MLDYSFGEMLKRFRERSMLSQRQLAAQVGIDTSYISRLENGEREITSRGLAIKIAETLHLTDEEADLWLISAGYISPRLQYLASEGISRLMESISGSNSIPPENTTDSQ